MAEHEQGMRRAWVDFTNPEDADEVLRCDLTWLTSRWTCIFGQGCPGIDAEAPDAGCCIHGAHFSDDDDHSRVATFVAELDPTAWELHDSGMRDGWTQTDEEGSLKTRVVDGACIFHNSKGFGGGYGCALHAHALANNLPITRTKPDVCWQLPIRRTYESLDLGDGEEKLLTVVSEYTRAGWGAGGHDFDWYCSAATEAHVGSQPVYVQYRVELSELLGEAGYELLVGHCEKFIDAGRPVPHAAD